MHPTSPNAGVDRPFSPSPPRESNHTYSRPPSLLFGAPAPALYTLAFSSALSLEGLPDTPPESSVEALGEVSGQGDQQRGRYEQSPRATPIRPKRNRAQSDSSTSSSSPPLGATSLLAALVGNANNDSTRSLALYNSDRGQSPYAIHPRDSTSSTSDLPNSPRSTFSKASESTASFFSSTRSQPRLHQPTVVRRPSGRKLGFLPAPAQLSPSISASTFDLGTPAKTGQRARHSMPVRAVEPTTNETTAHRRSRKASESGVSTEGWGTFRSSGDLFNSPSQVEGSASRHRQRGSLPTFAGGLTGSLASQDAADERTPSAVAVVQDEPHNVQNPARLDPSRPSEALPDPTIPASRFHSPQIASRIISTAPQLGRIWSHASQATNPPIGVLKRSPDLFASSAHTAPLTRPSALPSLTTPSLQCPASKSLGIPNVPLVEPVPDVRDDTIVRERSYASSNSDDNLPTPRDLSTPDELSSNEDAIAPVSSESLDPHHSIPGSDSSESMQTELVKAEGSITTSTVPTSLLSRHTADGGVDKGPRNHASLVYRENASSVTELGAGTSDDVGIPRVADERTDSRGDHPHSIDLPWQLPRRGHASDHKVKELPDVDLTMPLVATDEATSTTSHADISEAGCTTSKTETTPSEPDMQGNDTKSYQCHRSQADVQSSIGTAPTSASDPGVIDSGEIELTTRLDTSGYQDGSARNADSVSNAYTHEGNVEHVEGSEEAGGYGTPGAQDVAAGENKCVTPDSADGTEIIKPELQRQLPDYSGRTPAITGREASLIADDTLGVAYIAPYETRKAPRNGCMTQAPFSVDQTPQHFVFCLSAGINRSAVSSIPFRPGRLELNFAWEEPKNWTWVPGRRLVPDWRLQLVPVDYEKSAKAQEREGLVRAVVVGIVSRIPVAKRFAGWL